MRVEFRMQGGLAYFPGLSKPAAINTDQLSDEDARELESRISAAQFFERPASTAPPRGAADHFQYTVTVEDEGRRHTIRFADPVEDRDLQALVDFLKAQVRAGRTAERDRPDDRGPDR